jgi:hypothetical protein
MTVPSPVGSQQVSADHQTSELERVDRLTLVMVASDLWELCVVQSRRGQVREGFAMLLVARCS